MTYEEKFELIIKAIADAKKYARKEYYPKLYYNKDNGLKAIDLSEIYDILLQLQDDEKIITVRDVPTGLKPLMGQSNDLLDGTKNYFTIDILETFDSWYEKRLIANKSRLENLSEMNLNNIIHIMHLIEQQLELDQSEKVIMSFVSSVHELEGYERADIDELINTYARSLTYLKNIGVINDFATSDMSLSSGLTLNITRFFEVLEQINNLGQKYKAINKEEQKEEASNKPPDKTDIVYEITYTKQRQILMNSVQIGKPDFNSENDLVFSFLYAHPNENFTKERIEKAVGVKLNKSLHKIVENLGFEGDTKEVFISASKNAIQFRNPITKKDLDEMKKATIKLVKGGGKLLLPR